MAAKKKETKNESTKPLKSDTKNNKKVKGDGVQKLSGTQRRRDPAEVCDIPTESLLDDKTKRDIVGIIFVLLAVISLILAVLPANAIVSSVASNVVHLLFGIGCYILPVVLLIIAGAYFWKSNIRVNPLRISLGFAIIFIGFLAVFALFTPISNLGQEEPNLLFTDIALREHGGYIGSGITWVGLMLFGRAITAVILIAVIIIGCVIVGFSVSKAIDQMRHGATKIGEISQGMRFRDGSHTLNTSTKQNQYAPAQYNAFSDDARQFLEAESAREGFDPSNTAVLGRPAQYLQGQNQYANPQQYQDAQFDPNFYAEQQYINAVPTSPQQAANIGHRLEVPDNISGDAVTMKLGSAHDFETFDPNNDSDEYLDSEQQQVFSGGLVPIVHEGITSRFESEDELDNVQDDYYEQDDYEDLDNFNEQANFDDQDYLDEQDNLNEQKSYEKQEQRDTSAHAHSDKKSEKKFKLPPMSLLQKSGKKNKQAKGALEQTAQALQDTLSDFGINATVVDWIPGPTVTLFEVDLPAGVRVSRITALNDDLALALASPGVRIFAPIPGTNYVGIEVPNTERETVLLSEVLRDAAEGPLQIAIGKDVEGNSVISDLAKMPHLLIGGTTGSGKSVSINGMIMSILMRATPDEVRFIMVDPKRVEFTPYNGIPHLYVPVVTEPSEAASALAWGVAEMERRLKVFSKLGVRNIAQYNAKVEEQQADIAAAEAAGLLNDEVSDDTSANEEAMPKSEYAKAFKNADEDILEKLPYIVIIIDELADLMMNIGKEVEISISRIAQLARAAGMHLIVATQRPSTNVVTGLIKANITNRIAFNVASGIDSRVILDVPGAESLIGHGDLLLSKPELAKPQRIQGCFVTEDEINKVVDFVKAQGEPDYHGEILNVNTVTIGSTSPNGATASGDRDPYVWEAAEMVVSSGLGSTSNIQRRLKVGYARAGRIMDQLEEMGIVGSANGSKPRDVLVDELELESIKAFEMAD